MKQTAANTAQASVEEGSSVRFDKAQNLQSADPQTYSY